MSPEAQHAAIASECGYYLIRDEESDSVALRNSDVNFRGPWHRAGDDGDQFAWEDAPDYLGDLNAMHDAEKAVILPESHLVEVYFSWKLPAVCDAYRVPHADTRATAVQRAEAFLRTIGKWDDTK